MELRIKTTKAKTQKVTHAHTHTHRWENINQEPKANNSQMKFISTIYTHTQTAKENFFVYVSFEAVWPAGT